MVTAMSEVATWETAVGSIFAVMIVAAFCKELANNIHLARPMTPNRKSFVMLAAFAALCGALYHYPLWERAPVAQATPATEAVAPAPAPVEPPPSAASAPPPPVAAAEPEAKAPSISNSSATSSVKGRRDDRRHRRRERSSFNPMPASRQSCPEDLAREPTRQVRTEPYRSVMEKRGSSPKPLRPVSVVASGATT